jgi:hypothetical protein
MPRPIAQRVNFASVPANELEATLRSMQMSNGGAWSNANQQRVFNRAIELYQRPNATAAHKNLANRVLTKLVRNYNRTWTQPVPPAARFRARPNNSNSNSNPSAGLVYGSNSNSKVRKFAERWRLKGAIKLVNLPTNRNNRTDPVSLHTFRGGQEAIQHQRRNTEGRIISTRYYLLPTIERLAGVNWKTIRRMHPNKVLVKGTGLGNKFLASKHVPNVITRLPMYRRNLTLVKFKSMS